MRVFGKVAVVLTAFAPFLAQAQDDAAQQETPAIEAPARPAASIADMAWLEGSWVGTGIGGNRAGESFSFAGDGQMVGHFWQLDANGAVQFYELITVIPDGESLVMRLKHFTGDLTGWEEKAGDTALVFPLIERSETRWKFGAVTFTRPAPDRLNVSVAVKKPDGGMGSFDFDYRRAGGND